MLVRKKHHDFYFCILFPITKCTCMHSSEGVKYPTAGACHKYTATIHRLPMSSSFFLLFFFLGGGGRERDFEYLLLASHH